MKLGTMREFLKEIAPVIPIFGIILYGFWGITQENNQLENEPVYVNGYIYEVHNSMKDDYVSYKFKANSKFYCAKEYSYNYMWDKVNVGDSCKVVYARSNPEISEILQNEDKKLKVFRQYRGASPIEIRDYDSINLKKEFSKYYH